MVMDVCPHPCLRAAFALYAGRGRSPPPASGGRGAAPADAPWMGSGSIFALLEEARQLEQSKKVRAGDRSRSA